MFETIRRGGKVTKLVLLAGGLWIASASSVQALDWCSGRRAAVIDCRSGTCVEIPSYEPSYWEVLKCEWNKFWNPEYPA